MQIDNIIKRAEEALNDTFLYFDTIERFTQERVLNAFAEHNISQRHFAPTTGYGYDDIGRDTLDKLFASALECEDAIVRPHFTSGTHAIYTALSGLLAKGDTMLSATGSPYDTLLSAIGITGDEYSSLKKMGVSYKQVELTEDNDINIDAVLNELIADESIKVVYFQRSRGYAWRESLLPEKLETAFKAIHDTKKDVAIVIDNCYGEFTCKHEPSYYGADVLIGSLIKNPGGGMAPTGGYIAGKANLIERISMRITVPGMGREVGSYAGSYTPFYQGLFMAPHIVNQALKTAALFAKLFESFNLETMPKSDAVRSDIVQSLKLNNEEAVIRLCKEIQKASPVDSFLVTEPWDMPGYADKVIMAAGAFIQGSSIELSADAPIKPPYIVYLQGGLTYSHGVIAAKRVLRAIKDIF